jgi:peptide/nickel transport system substrate-binding protein
MKQSSRQTSSRLIRRGTTHTRRRWPKAIGIQSWAALAAAAVLPPTGPWTSLSAAAGTAAPAAPRAVPYISPTVRAAASGAVSVVQGAAPDSLDPGFGYTTEAGNADWISYTGLVTYAHASGVAGTQLIPGVATDLGTVSPDGKTYTFTLRPGLVYSNGATVKASDFAYAIERAIRLNWGGKAFYTGNIVGAAAYDSGRAQSVSGITADDATGKITIRLLAPYGAFANLLAFPSSALVPSGTPMVDMTTNPPPGVGPYVITNVSAGGYSAVRNPNWPTDNIPGIPAGSSDFNVRFASNNSTEAMQVLNNSADVFDWSDELPGAFLHRIASQAADRFAAVTTAQTFYFFMNVKTRPFSSQLVREAVNYAIDRRALARLAGGFLSPACFFLPTVLVGHPTARCPYGNPTSAPKLAKAKALVRRARLAGTRVTVWGENVSPRKEWVDYYTSLLRRLGFKAKEKLLPRAAYFATVGTRRINAQTGFADWQQDFPNPIDFYLNLDGKAIAPVNNQNFSLVNDPHIQAELAVLGRVPATQLNSVAVRWQALDTYVAKKAYEVVFGYNQSAKFFSNRIDFAGAAFNPIYGPDWTTISFK